MGELCDRRKKELLARGEPLAHFLPVRIALLIATLGAATAVSAGWAATVIINASVFDGTGRPAQAVEVRIDDGQIVAVGKGLRKSGDTIFNAKGLALAPGFIDTHSHHDEGISRQPGALAAVSQGITTIVAGQDGESEFPLADFFARLEKSPVAVNVASCVGHGTIRARIMGDDFKRAATDAEVARMRELVREEMASGALGLSTGLEYDPGIFSAASEVLTLAQVAGEAGGCYISHIRSEDRGFWPALDEIINIGRVARMSVHISHLKLGMRALWGQGDKLIARLNAARAEGVRISADVYPYTMWQSTLTVLYPKRNFTDRAETDFILKEVAAPDDIVLGAFEAEPALAGKTVGQIVRQRGTDAATTLMALIAESQARRSHESAVVTGMAERDIADLLRWPHANVCSDGGLNSAHPRGFGSFPRVLGHYVREKSIIALPEAIRKMTALAAANVGIKNRGTIQPGMAADLVLFDPKKIKDHATLKQPHALSAGIQTVWVNGEVVFEYGKTTGRRPGRVVRRVSTAAPADLQPRIDEFVRAELSRQRVPGVSVGIVNQGQVTARGYGYANLEHLVPVTENTIFQSGSLGKMLTATAVMLLVEDGKLSLADNLTKFFPDAPDSWREITVRHLLNHTSGLREYTTNAFDFRRDYTEDELAHYAFGQPLDFPPGSKWRYCNTGYALLGFIVHKVSGKFYGDVLAQRVFKPLGMTATRVISEADIVPNRAAGYCLTTNGEIKNQEWVAPQLNTTADGSLYWSMKDALIWDAVVKQRKILKPDSWKEVLSPARLNDGKTHPYGMGWFLDDRGGKPLHRHSGSWQGFKTQIMRFVGDDLDIIVFANLDKADPARIANGIAAIINPSLAPKPDAKP